MKICLLHLQIRQHKVSSTIEDATRELLKAMNPAIFEIKFFDKEDNEIWNGIVVELKITKCFFNRKRR